MSIYAWAAMAAKPVFLTTLTPSLTRRGDSQVLSWKSGRESRARYHPQSSSIDNEITCNEIAGEC